MEPGWEPRVKIFFLRILRSISWGLLWMFAFVTAGLYNRLAMVGERPLVYHLLFYGVMSVSFFFFLRYVIRNWKGEA